MGKNVIDLLPTITATTGTKATFGFSGGPLRSGPVAAVAARMAPARGGGGRGARGGGGAGHGRLGNRGGGTWPNYYTAAAEICMWDILGKAVNRPIYKLLGGTKDRVMAYASSQHLPNVEDYIADVLSRQRARLQRIQDPSRRRPAEDRIGRFRRMSATSRRSRTSAKRWATISSWRTIRCSATTFTRR